MTPTLPEILTGIVVTLATPPAEESAGDFHSGMAGVCVMLAALAAQEAERGPAAAVWENQALLDLFARTAPRYGEQLTVPASAYDGDGSLSALAASNAELRRRLIDLHAAVEAASDKALDREILELYAAMAERRRLELPALG